MVSEESLADVIRIRILAFIGFFHILQLCLSGGIVDARAMDQLRAL